LEEFGLGTKAIGYFMPFMRANYAVIADTPLEFDDTLKHEYLHFLVRNRDSINYPTWFDEGFAELLQTLTVNGTTIEYGKVSRNRMGVLPPQSWLRFDALVEGGGVGDLDRDRRWKFYAQSWLLMHYLSFGRPERRFDADYPTFLRLSE